MNEVLSKAKRILRTARWLGEKYPRESAIDGIYVLALGIVSSIKSPAEGADESDAA